MISLVYQGGDQTVPLVLDERVESVSYILEDSEAYPSGSDARTLASGTAPVDSFSAGLSFEAGARTVNPRKIYLDASSGLSAGRTYELVHSGSNEAEPVLLETSAHDPVSGSYALANYPLIGTSYPSGSTLQGRELRIVVSGSVTSNRELFERGNPLTLTLEWTTDEKRNRVRRLLSIERQSDSDFDLVKIEQRLNRMFGPMSARFGDGHDMNDLIESAAQDVKADLLNSDIKPERYLFGDIGTTLIAWRTVYLLSINPFVRNTQDMADFSLKAEAEYRKYMDGLKVGKAPDEVKTIDPIDEQSKEKKWDNPFTGW